MTTVKQPQGLRCPHCGGVFRRPYRGPGLGTDKNGEKQMNKDRMQPSKDNAAEISHTFVEELRASNPKPTGKLQVTEKDLARLERAIAKTIRHLQS